MLAARDTAVVRNTWTTVAAAAARSLARYEIYLGYWTEPCKCH